MRDFKFHTGEVMAALKVHYTTLGNPENEAVLHATAGSGTGMLNPAFGINLFAAYTVAKISLDKIIVYLIPFVLVILACLMVVTSVPQLSLFLRDLVYAK